MVEYDGEITCPYCGHKGKNFKLIKDWAHGMQLVNRLKCPECEGDFRFYWGEKMDGKEFSYTIPKSLNTKDDK